MAKYNLNKTVVEVKYNNRKEIKEGVTLDAENVDVETIKSFVSAEEALKELGEYKSGIYEFENNGIKMYEVTEYWVEVVESEEGSDFFEGDILDFSEIRIELVAENATADTLGIFDNIEDAERAMKATEEECHLSF